ncbi:MAG: HsdR family type I site-specific deoxyribonuclease [Ardenticatenales bacterium]|nr:HsdR family type I site-specific deoxyribonuclease [Ardenticatenales bacterium]MCB9171725.1 HsdR family type I site-specific deoxyribonuclease [Ardenticatenales bacterium]
MSQIGERERHAQNRAVAFLRDDLGYRYLGNWQDREENRNVEPELLTAWLRDRGCDEALIPKTVRQVEQAATLGGSTTLYEANQALYSLLRYGVKVQPAPGAPHETVWLVDWDTPEANDFALAEEVTVRGQHRKRPDVVLYVNGIALVVIELKRAIVSISEGIRQSLDNQEKRFIQPFFTTVQLLLVGSESEGVRYGVIETPEKYWLQWKEGEHHPAAGDNRLLQGLGHLCAKARFLDLIHNFIVFDSGTKKTARYNQFVGVHKAQPFVQRREGGILWHTQGSGKSLTMVWLAKWIRENVPGSRVLIVTDRTELDEQIEKVFAGVGENIYRTRSGADLVNVLNRTEPWLLCSLIHKFGRGDDLSEQDLDSYLAEIDNQLPTNFHAKGQLFVFVDECHRTQSGKLHQAMKRLMPDATLIGFTGTPLLKADTQSTLELFGPYIHSYKYDEAVRDGVVLDLRYEARDIDQNLSSSRRVDEWFESKTKGLTDVARAELKRRWGTMQKLFSSRDRLDQIAQDILLDMARHPRLSEGQGNAMVVTDSIYSACRLFEIFRSTDLKGKCAIVTSYRPNAASIKGEESGEGETERLLQYDVYRQMLADHFKEPIESAASKTEQFEQQVKERFITQPGQMKLLIVVDKLLTGFDAPPATYLYIDKPMRDHGLFQAICRVNRLDEGKDYGYIVDYRDLFKSLAYSMKQYTGEALDGYAREDVEGLLKDRLTAGRERLDETLEAVRMLCENVAPPRANTDYFHYFCAAESGNGIQLKENEPKRVRLYQSVASLLRAYAAIANELDDAGYSEAERRELHEEVTHYSHVRDEVKLNSGDYVDMKQYEPGMRRLLDSYVRADESEKLSAFDDMSLVELLIEQGEAALENLPDDLRSSLPAMAETIENNVRRLIIDESKVNPRYYEKMSELLDALIEERRRNALDYQAYLDRIVELTRQVRQPPASAYPATLSTPLQRALYDNLPRNATEGALQEHAASYSAGRAVNARERQALALARAIDDTRQADWRGNLIKERQIKRAIYNVVRDDPLVEQLFELVWNQTDG